MPSLGIPIGQRKVPGPQPPGLLKDPRLGGFAASDSWQPQTSENSVPALLWVGRRFGTPVLGVL